MAKKLTEIEQRREENTKNLRALVGGFIIASIVIAGTFTMAHNKSYHCNKNGNLIKCSSSTPCEYVPNPQNKYEVRN